MEKHKLVQMLSTVGFSYVFYDRSKLLVRLLLWLLKLLLSCWIDQSLPFIADGFTLSRRPHHTAPPPVVLPVSDGPIRGQSHQVFTGRAQLGPAGKDPFTGHLVEKKQVEVLLTNPNGSTHLSIRAIKTATVAFMNGKPKETWHPGFMSV